MNVGTRFKSGNTYLIEKCLKDGPKRQREIVEYVRTHPECGSNNSEAAIRWLIYDMVYGYYWSEYGYPIIITKKGYILNPEYPERTIIDDRLAV